MTSLEQAWAVAIFEAIFPGDPARGLPSIRTMKVAEFLDDMMRASPSQVGWGLRAALVLMALSPIVLLGRLRTMAGLTLADREKVLLRLIRSDSYYVRQLSVAVKGVAALLYGGHPTVRKCLYAPRAPENG